jgi:hypothetical protein
LTAVRRFSAARYVVYEFFWWVIRALVLAPALYILYDNLRELTRPAGS